MHTTICLASSAIVAAENMDDFIDCQVVVKYPQLDRAILPDGRKNDCKLHPSWLDRSSQTPQFNIHYLHPADKFPTVGH